MRRSRQLGLELPRLAPTPALIREVCSDWAERLGPEFDQVLGEAATEERRAMAICLRSLTIARLNRQRNQGRRR